MNSKIERYLQETGRLESVFEDLNARADEYLTIFEGKDLGEGGRMLDQIRTIAADQLQTLSQLRTALTSGNGFLAGFSLWLAGRNANRLEKLMTAAEEVS